MFIQLWNDESKTCPLTFSSEADEELQEKNARKSNVQTREQAEGKPLEQGEIPSLIPEQNSDDDIEIHEEQSSKTVMKDKGHKIWLPEKQPNRTDLFSSLQSSSNKQNEKPQLLQRSESKLSLRSRQRLVNDRIHITQAVLPNEILNKQRKKMTFKEATEHVIARQRSNLRVSDVVSQYLAKMKAEGVTDVAASMKDFGGVMKSNNFPSTVQRRRYDAQISDAQGGKGGSLPVETWHKIVKQTSVSLDDAI